MNLVITFEFPCLTCLPLRFPQSTPFPVSPRGEMLDSPSPQVMAGMGIIFKLSFYSSNLPLSPFPHRVKSFLRLPPWGKVGMGVEMNIKSTTKSLKVPIAIGIHEGLTKSFNFANVNILQDNFLYLYP
jgi:hypothetical protein